MYKVLNYIFLFFLLVLSQIFIFDNINIGGYVDIYVYILLILMLPMEMKHSLSVIIGFSIGALIDLLSGSIGLHMMMATLLAFIRPTLLLLIVGKEVCNTGGIPSVRIMRKGQFLGYIITSVLIFNTGIFVFETLSLHNFLHVLLRIIFSTTSTSAIIYIIHMMAIRKI